MIEKNKYFVYPYNSFSTKFGDIGTHFKRRSHRFQVPLSLSVDLYATKKEESYKRYVLTTKKMNYKIINMYDLTMKPIEDNIRHVFKAAVSFFMTLP